MKKLLITTVIIVSLQQSLFGVDNSLKSNYISSAEGIIKKILVLRYLNLVPENIWEELGLDINFNQLNYEKTVGIDYLNVVDVYYILIDEIRGYLEENRVIINGKNPFEILLNCNILKVLNYKTDGVNIYKNGRKIDIETFRKDFKNLIEKNSSTSFVKEFINKNSLVDLKRSILDIFDSVRYKDRSINWSILNSYDSMTGLEILISAGIGLVTGYIIDSARVNCGDQNILSCGWDNLISFFSSNSSSESTFRNTYLWVDFMNEYNENGEAILFLSDPLGPNPEYVYLVNPYHEDNTGYLGAALIGTLNDSSDDGQNENSNEDDETDQNEEDNESESEINQEEENSEVASNSEEENNTEEDEEEEIMGEGDVTNAPWCDSGDGCYNNGTTGETDQNDETFGGATFIAKDDAITEDEKKIAIERVKILENMDRTPCEIGENCDINGGELNGDLINSGDIDPTGVDR